MTMDPTYPEPSDYISPSKIDEQTLIPSLDQYPLVENGVKFDLIPSPDIFMSYPFEPSDPDLDSFKIPITLSPGAESLLLSPSLSPDEGSSFPSSGWSPEGEASSPSEDSDSTDPVLKYISQILMEENMDGKPHMFDDPLALKATEKSLYDVIGEQYPSSAHNSPRPYAGRESPDLYLSGSGSDYGGNTSTSNSSSTSAANAAEPGTSYVVDHRSIGGIGDGGESLNPSLTQSSFPNDYHFHFNPWPGSQFTVNSSSTGQPVTSDGLMGSSASEMVQNIFSHNESMLQFKRGLEEASKFLPTATQLVIDLESSNYGTELKERAPIMEVKRGKIEGESLMNGLRGRKNHEREDAYLEEGRSNKQSAVYVDESELSELFDRVLLWNGAKSLCCNDEAKESEDSKASQPDEQSHRSNNGKTQAKNQGKKNETVDLRALLILCAQAVSANDFRTANEMLKQVRQNSSSLGDGFQRLAHYFANGLEARMAGIAIQVTSMTRMKSVDILKAYKAHLYSCPFKKLSIFYSNKMIYHAATKAETLHVIDFGVSYGFQWPILIQKLSMRQEGPPKLRITGIEIPQPGFRPAERIEETGRRLANYCGRFNVLFEFIPIAAKDWENIPIEDLKINRNEVIAVNNMGRFENLLDETFEANSCPRNAVLKLIRKVNPDIFVNTIINGSYNSPFFVTRFKETLFHFSSLFDMFDTTLPRESQERLMLEEDFYGREAMNAIACEGVERVNRPETYKQWQVRTTRAGFKQLPLNQEVVQFCNNKMKSWYHKDFVMDEDSNWMLQGWKGRILFASSCWVPAQ